MHRQASAQSLFATAAGGFLLGVLVCHRPTGRAERQVRDAQWGAARTACERWADALDRDTTAAGVYNRFAGDALPDADPWGRPGDGRRGQDGGRAAGPVTVSPAAATGRRPPTASRAGRRG